jgi:hypothetical protein
MASTVQRQDGYLAPSPSNWLISQIGLESQPIRCCQIIKHIPRSARPHMAAELSSVINDVIANHKDPTHWSSLLECGPRMFHAPPRTGRRHSLANELMKRSMSSTQLEAGTVKSRHRPARVSDDQCSRTEQIENGNIKAAVRIITSDDRTAADSAETV